MATAPNWASNATYSTGSESGLAPTVSPGASAIADGFLPDDDIPAVWLNWALRNITTPLRALEDLFSSSKLLNTALGLLDGGSVALAALLQFSLSGVTSHVVHEQGSAAIGAGGSGRVKKRFSYLRTTDATANQVLDTYTPGNDVSGLIDAWVLAINRTTTTEEGLYHIRHGFVNRGGTTTLIGTVNLLATEDDAAWACSTSVSTPAVRIVVTGEAANNIDWIVFWTISEMTHPT